MRCSNPEDPGCSLPSGWTGQVSSTEIHFGGREETLFDRIPSHKHSPIVNIDIEIRPWHEADMMDFAEFIESNFPGNERRTD